MEKYLLLSRLRHISIRRIAMNVQRLLNLKQFDYGSLQKIKG